MSVTRATGAGTRAATTSTNPQRKLGRDIGKLSNRRASAAPPLHKHAAIPPPGSDSLRTHSNLAKETTTESRFLRDASGLHQATKDLSEALPKESASKGLKTKLQDFEKTISKMERRSSKNPPIKHAAIHTITTKLFERLRSTSHLPRRSDADEKALNFLRKIATFRDRYSDQFSAKGLGGFTRGSISLTNEIKQFFRQQGIAF